MIHFNSIPTFRITDYKLAMQFYIDFLACNVDWEHRFKADDPVYMQISKDGLILHLTENQRFQTGSVVFILTEGLDQFCVQLEERQNDFFNSKIEKTAWGTKQPEIKDPFGNLLRLNENVTEYNRP